MPTHTQIFESMGSLLDCIASTRDALGEWTRYANNSSLRAGWNDMPTTLADALDMARTLRGHGAQCAMIDALAAELQASLPAPQSVKRVPAWGRQGTRLNINKVLAGNLQSCWRTTTRAHRPQAGRILTLIVQGAYSAHVESTQIAWTVAATLAYAAACEQAGYRVDLWYAGGGTALYATGANGLTLLRLKRPETPWNTQNLALTANATFYRRLLFRAWEHSTGEHGALESSYGLPWTPGPLQEALQGWALEQGYLPESLVYGAHQQDKILGAEGAQQWLATRLDALAA